MSDRRSSIDLLDGLDLDFLGNSLGDSFDGFEFDETDDQNQHHNQESHGHGGDVMSGVVSGECGVMDSGDGNFGYRESESGSGRGRGDSDVGLDGGGSQEIMEERNSLTGGSMGTNNPPNNTHSHSNPSNHSTHHNHHNHHLNHHSNHQDGTAGNQEHSLGSMPAMPMPMPMPVKDRELPPSNSSSSYKSASMANSQVRVGMIVIV
jgi:hypothetical protein